MPAAHFTKAYEAFSGRLRNWLTAYGVGVPIFLATSNIKFQHPSLLKSAVVIYLLGVAIQIIGAIVYKYKLAPLHFAEVRDESTTDEKRGDFYYKRCPDTAIDAVTLALYLVATAILLVGGDFAIHDTTGS